MLTVLFLTALCGVAVLATGPKITNKVFFDVTIGGGEAQRIVFGLYGATGKSLAARWFRYCTCLKLFLCCDYVIANRNLSHLCLVALFVNKVFSATLATLALALALLF